MPYHSMHCSFQGQIQEFKKRGGGGGAGGGAVGKKRGGGGLQPLNRGNLYCK